MTESGLKFANWLDGHRENLLVLVSYVVLFILLVFAVGISSLPPQPDAHTLDRSMSQHHESSAHIW